VPEVRANASRACSTSWSGRPPERQVDDRVRPAADVDDRVGQRFVHRRRRVTEPANAGSIAERFGER
jgi:hypothetical protein